MPYLAMWAFFLEPSTWFSGPSTSTAGAPIGPYGGGPLIQVGLPVRDANLPRM